MTTLALIRMTLSGNLQMDKQQGMVIRRVPIQGMITDLVAFQASARRQ